MRQDALILTQTKHNHKQLGEEREETMALIGYGAFNQGEKNHLILTGEHRLTADYNNKANGLGNCR